jgi:hypothetical protein
MIFTQFEKTAKEWPPGNFGQSFDLGGVCLVEVLVDDIKHGKDSKANNGRRHVELDEGDGPPNTNNKCYV